MRTNKDAQDEMAEAARQESASLKKQRSVILTSAYTMVLYPTSIPKSTAWEHLLYNYPDAVKHVPGENHPWKKCHHHVHNMWGWRVMLVTMEELVEQEMEAWGEAENCGCTDETDCDAHQQ